MFIIDDRLKKFEKVLLLKQLVKANEMIKRLGLNPGDFDKFL